MDLSAAPSTIQRIISYLGGSEKLNTMIGVEIIGYIINSKGNPMVGFRHNTGNEGTNFTEIELMGDETYTMRCYCLDDVTVTRKQRRGSLYSEDLIPAFEMLSGLTLKPAQLH